MKYTLVLSPRAKDDLDDLWDFVAEAAGLHRADSVIANIRERCDQLRALPYLGRPRDELRPGLRSLVANQWVIFYRVRSDAVEVVRVLHGRRDLELLL